jgi:hypothetical protein
LHCEHDNFEVAPADCHWSPVAADVLLTPSYHFDVAPAQKLEEGMQICHTDQEVPPAHLVVHLIWRRKRFAMAETAGSSEQFHCALHHVLISTHSKQPVQQVLPREKPHLLPDSHALQLKQAIAVQAFWHPCQSPPVSNPLR